MSTDALALEPRVGRRWSARPGAAAGAASAIVFTALHDLLISDIWFNVVPMAIAGALCGLCLAWSHAAAAATPSTATWYAYVAATVGVLVALGAVSLLVLDPITSMAALMASTDPLGEVIPSALPLMGWASVIGAISIWAVFGRRPGALLPVAVTQTLLVLLVGHNLAILGLVEIPPGSRYLVVEFVALTVVLAALCAGLYVVAESPRWRRRR